MGQLSGRPTRRATRTGRARSTARASSPTPRSASAARPARSPARSGTATRATAIWSCSGRPTTTPARWAPAPGGTSRSSSRAREQHRAGAGVRPGAGRVWACRGACAGRGAAPDPVDTTPPDTAEFRWLMSSDVCKHCTHAGCLDVCPTGALFRTEFGTVVVQDDVCNGCGTCVAGCPFGVIERRADGTVAANTRQRAANIAEVPNDGRRPEVHALLRPARSTARPRPAPRPARPRPSSSATTTIWWPRPGSGWHELHAQGMTEARLYGANENDGVGGTGSVFLLLDEPEVYGLPPDPRVPHRRPAADVQPGRRSPRSG